MREDIDSFKRWPNKRLLKIGWIEILKNNDVHQPEDPSKTSQASFFNTLLECSCLFILLRSRPRFRRVIFSSCSRKVSLSVPKCFISFEEAAQLQACSEVSAYVKIEGLQDTLRLQLEKIEDKLW